MPVYVDKEKMPYGRMIMCHMLADTVDELHAMAGNIGINRKWFQNHGTPHYDICKSKRLEAVTHGAIEVGRRQLVTLIRKLRREKAATI